MEQRQMGPVLRVSPQGWVVLGQVLVGIVVEFVALEVVAWVEALVRVLILLLA